MTPVRVQPMMMALALMFVLGQPCYAVAGMIEGAAGAPEIDPGAATSALGFVAGSVLLLVDRMRPRTQRPL